MIKNKLDKLKNIKEYTIGENGTLHRDIKDLKNTNEEQRAAISSIAKRILSNKSN